MPMEKNELLLSDCSVNLRNRCGFLGYDLFSCIYVHEKYVFQFNIIKKNLK